MTNDNKYCLLWSTTKYDGLYANYSVDNHKNYSTMKSKCELPTTFLQLFFNFFQLYSQITLWQSIPQLASFWLIITEIHGDFFFWRNVTDVFSSIFSVYAEFRLFTWVLRTFMYQKYFKKLKVFISVTISFLSDTFVSKNSSKIE